MEDEKIITLFEQRSERALTELDTKYGKVCRIIETASGALDMKSPSGFCVNSVMQINAHYRTKYYKTRGLWQAIACHEFGHALCLDHNTSSSPSIMRRVTKHYYIDGASKWTTPKSADIVPINLKY